MKINDIINEIMIIDNEILQISCMLTPDKHDPDVL